MANWVITKFESNNEQAKWEMPPGMDDSEVEEVLRRLVSRGLSETEIIDASRRRNDKSRNTLLDRIGVSRPIQFGENPYFVAKLEKE